MRKKFLSFLFLAVIFFFIVAGLQPAEFHVERALTIKAPAATIFAQVNDLHRWNAWSPWAKLDPNATTEFKGPKAGVGANMHWEGNQEVGVGTMTIIESEPNKHLALQLDFEKPLAGRNRSDFTFSPAEGGGTLVTWSMDGHKNFAAKAIGLLLNCEKMVGEQYEQGLANLQQTVAK